MSDKMGLLVLWLLPASWFVHDLEEIATIETWSSHWKRSGRERKSTIQKRIVEMMASTRRQFTIAVAFVGCVIVGATIAAVVDPLGIGIVVYTMILGGYFLHAFVHIGQWFALRGYSPGLATAVIVVIPVSVYLYLQLLSAQLVDVGTAVTSSVVGIALFGPIVIGANKLAGLADRRFD